jgi:hypothetical protein
MKTIILILLLVLAVYLFRKYQADVQYRKLSRLQVFNDCSDLLEGVVHSADLAGLPIVQGSYNGYQVALSIVEDTIAWRKLPPLWMLVKVSANKSSQGTFDMIVRPANNEFYSPSWQWDGNLQIPANWPQHAIIKYQHQPLDIALLNDYVPQLFSDNKMKELLVTASVLRLSYMVKQAVRGEYLIMRNAVYESAPIDRALVESLLRQAVAMRKNIENAAL